MGLCVRVGAGVGRQESNPAAVASVIMSGKPNAFIGGADIAMLDTCKTTDDFAQITGPVHGVFNQLERCARRRVPGRLALFPSGLPLRAPVPLCL